MYIVLRTCILGDLCMLYLWKTFGDVTSISLINVLFTCIRALQTTHVCENCPIIVSVLTFLVDLIFFPLKAMDVVLGMDWLSVNQVYIGCKEKEIFVPPKTMTEGEVFSTLFDSTHQLIQCLFGGEQNFILMLSTDFKAQLDVSSILIVKEFVDVFPKDITSLPPNREVEFSINLIQGAGPVLVSPYRMSPLELKELKGQLEDLIKKHFLRPSVSPWGALVLLVKKKEGGMRLCIDYR
jgi:hypothetical protein